MKGFIFFTILLSSLVASAELRFSPFSVNFGTVDVDYGGSRYSSARLYNSGNEVIRNIYISDNCSIDFNVSGYCPMDLRPGESCSFNLGFSPMYEGFHSCSLTARGSNSYDRLSLSGRGISRR